MRWVRAVLRLVPLAGFAALTACVPPAPLSVSGALPPPSTTYAFLGDDSISLLARQPIVDALALRGMRWTDHPDRIITVTLADRPRASGTVAGTSLPTSRKGEGWTDRPVKDGLFSRGQREVRLTIRFLSPDGQLREERVAHEVVTRKAPAADMARLVTAALR